MNEEMLEKDLIELTGEDGGTYTFEVKSGPFHLQAEIAAVDDKVNAISEKGNRGKLIKPATFQKISSFYKLVSKGEIELL